MAVYFRTIKSFKKIIMKTRSPFLLKNTFLFSLLVLSLSACKKDHTGPEPVTAPTEFHQTAKTQFIETNGAKIAYRILGNARGMPLILVSSLGSTMDDWDPLVTNGLSQKRPVILFDIQGAGSSAGTTPDNISEMAKGVVAFTKKLGYSKADFLGFSMGSFITQQIALTEPSLVNKMILTGTGQKGAEGLLDLPKHLAASAGLSPQDAFLKFGFTGSPASISAGKAVYNRIQKRVIDRDQPLSQQSSVAELTAVLAWAQPDANALKALESVQQPTLIVQGEQDVLVPAINAKRMAEHLPHGKLVLLPDAAHAAFFQNADLFVEMANKFFTQP
jgi:pimeloyl-ACP methyl ester carboxylesterase